MIKDPAIRRQLIWLILPALALVLLAPLVLDTYTINILIRALFFAMLALTVDVLWGYTGYLTFGQSAFFGAGAYAAGLVFTHLGFGSGYFLLAAVLAVVAALMIGSITGWLSFYHGSTPLYASVISLVLPIVLTQVLFSGGTFTGSSSGLTGYEVPDLDLETWFRIVGAALVVLTAFTCIFLRSDGGRILSAIRDNETRCSYLGIDISRYKIYLLVATGIVASLAGFGYASFSGVVAPELAGFVFGTEVIIWVALGGRGTIMGPVLGAVLIDWSSAYLSGNLPYVWKLFLGITFVLVIVLLPKGLLPAILKWFNRGEGKSTQPNTLKLVQADTTSMTGDDKFVAIELRGVAKSFGSLNVLSDITFSARAGELVSLIGPNGAGKTTLMRCISDGAERGGGTIHIQGQDIKLAPPHQCVQLGLGRKFQTATVFDSLTVAECLRIARTRIETPSFTTRSNELRLPSYALEVLHATELDKKLNVVASTLSHGEKQALELAMVLALEPRVVLLDEPTAGLSQHERSLIGRILVDLTSRFGLCLLLVEHDLDFVREISSRIVVLHQGRLVMEGTVREVVDSDLVKTIYSGSLGHA